MINIEIANSMISYFETLYNMNQKLLKLCGMDINYSEEYLKPLLEIINDISRMIPYKYNIKNKKLELENRSGLLEFKENMDYLEEKYNEILENNYKFLDKVRIIRNKYEHKMHGIRVKSCGCGSMILFDYTFRVFENKEEIYITVNSGEFIKLIKKLNLLYNIIVNDIQDYAIKNNKTEYKYYQRLCNFDFLKFNELYESDLLRTIGICIREL